MKKNNKTVLKGQVGKTNIELDTPVHEDTFGKIRVKISVIGEYSIDLNDEFYSENNCKTLKDALKLDLKYALEHPFEFIKEESQLLDDAKIEMEIL